MAARDSLERGVLPIPDRKPVDLTTSEAKAKGLRYNRFHTIALCSPRRERFKFAMARQ